mgnify:CR=1 FL=1
MSVSTPDRSPNARKKSRNILRLQEKNRDKTCGVCDEVDQALNIDDMAGDKIKSKVKVLILWLNGFVWLYGFTHPIE